MTDKVFEKEFLYASGDGGYLYTSTALCNTRKYHGLYVRPIDRERYVLLSTLNEQITLDKECYNLSTMRYTEDIYPQGYKNIVGIKNYPSVTFQLKKMRVKKEMLISQDNKNLLVKYSFFNVNAPIKVEITPYFAYRNINELNDKSDYSTSVNSVDGGVSYSPYSHLPHTYIQFNCNNHFIEGVSEITDVFYPVEQIRGYDAVENLVTIGRFSIIVDEDSSFILSCSLNMEDTSRLTNLFDEERHRLPELMNIMDRLHFAASQFMVNNNGENSVIAGYPWFGARGRDTFISLPHLYLPKGYVADFEHVVDSMIAKMSGVLFPNSDGNYRSVDTSLWFFHAIQHLEVHKGWEYICNRYYALMLSILDNYRDGVEGVVRQHESSLLQTMGEASYTWMDSMVDGKPAVNRLPFQVEVNALWYNAVCYLLSLAAKVHDADTQRRWGGVDEQIREAFKKYFWDESSSSLVDSVSILDYETDEFVCDNSVRPNQIIATSLKFTPLNRREVASVVDMVREELLTPYGLRSLSVNAQNYRPFYGGDAVERDLAYHNGTVWVWLLSHYVEGGFVAYGDNFIKDSEQIFSSLVSQLDARCVGSLPELFDGDYPHEPKGATAQAWSVAAAIHIAKLIEGRIY